LKRYFKYGTSVSSLKGFSSISKCWGLAEFHCSNRHRAIGTFLFW